MEQRLRSAGLYQSSNRSEQNGEMNITEFLLARIAEDEAEVPWADVEGRRMGECEAKRRIVTVHAVRVVSFGPGWGGKPDEYVCSVCAKGHDNMGCEDEPWPCPTLRAIASVYADHADFREEWKA